ncbi:MAG: hypothetical protein JWR16_76 [Nevskia sp.]|nr:hypothetical protein [Nevskia sp.]
MHPILNIADAQTDHTLTHGAQFEMRMAQLTDKLGAAQIGANLTTVPPGKAAFPFHHHHVNEEHFFIVRGNGVLRFGEQRHTVKPGDYVVAPAGGPELAHQFINTGSEELAYLAISTNRAPEVVGYPDSQRTGVRTVPYGEPGPAAFFIDDRQRDAISYWDGEDGSPVRAVIEQQQTGSRSTS